MIKSSKTSFPQTDRSLIGFGDTIGNFCKNPVLIPWPYIVPVYLKEFNKSKRFVFIAFCFSLMSSKHLKTDGGCRISVLFMNSL